jgi:hypothetical protein
LDVEVLHPVSEPRASRIVLPHPPTELWMGGAESALGEPLHPDDLAGAWVIDCAGDMPEHYRSAAAWWRTHVFQDYEELPAAWVELGGLARSIGRCLAGALDGDVPDHPVDPPLRLYVLCNQGMNRSGLVLGRILRALGLPGDEALDTLRRHRPGALNNLTFVRLVQED